MTLRPHFAAPTLALLAFAAADASAQTLGAPRAAVTPIAGAEAPFDEARIEAELVRRNAERRARDGVEAKAARAEMDEARARAKMEEATTCARGSEDAERASSEEHAALVHAHHVAGGALLSAGAALLAGGIAAAVVSSVERANIRSGGFATGSDISSAATTATSTEGLAYALVPIGAGMTLAGLGVFFIVPSKKPASSGWVTVRDGVFVW